MKIILSAACLLSILASCDNTDLRTDEAELKVNVSLATSQTRSSISTFSSGDKIGVYVTEGSLSLPYFGVPSNAEMTYNGKTWDTTTKVYLMGKKATVYAYYPFSVNAGNGKSIPVNTSSQTDYLYGKGDKQVYSEQTSVNIEMKHAFTRVLFKIKKQDYAQKAVLKSITITGTSSFPVYTTGSLDCETGYVLGSGGNGNISLTCNDVLQNTYNALHERIIFPMVASTTISGAISATFEVQTDVTTERYKVDFPAGTFWEQGKSYTYPLTLNGYGVHINNTEVTITPWGNTLTGNGGTM